MFRGCKWGKGEVRKIEGGKVVLRDARSSHEQHKNNRIWEKKRRNHCEPKARSVEFTES